MRDNFCNFYKPAKKTIIDQLNVAISKKLIKGTGA